MILIEQGFVGSALSPKHIMISGQNFLVSSLTIKEFPLEEKISIYKGEMILFFKQGYASFTADNTLFTPVSSYDELLILLSDLMGVYAPGMKYRKLVSTADTNEMLVKEGKVSLFQVFISNGSGNAAYLKLYDKATEPVAGVDLPFMVIDTAAVKDSIVFQPAGLLRRGLGITITASVDDGDATPVMAGDVLMTLVFE